MLILQMKAHKEVYLSMKTTHFKSVRFSIQKYIIPFELTSVILLVALVGAIILAKKDEKEEDSNE